MQRLALPPALALATALMALPAAHAAQGWGVSANLITEAVSFHFGGPTESARDLGNLQLDNDPLANTLNALDRQAKVSNNGVATARFLGSVGLLKAYASARYPYCCASFPVLSDGSASATVTSSFGDLITVSGAGLAVGTPVSYRVDFRIDGALVTAPSPGQHYGATADASVSLQDEQSFQSVVFNWDATRQTTGLYSIVLNTAVGHTLSLFGRLNVGAQVAGNSPVGRFAEADFYNSAHYNLAPSVAGLNTVGASGHDFAVSSVPEPQTWLQLGLGLLALRRLRARQRG